MSAKRWVVLEPPLDGEPSETADAKFVKDAFAPLAFFLVVFWLFWHRLWLAGIAVLALDIALILAGQIEGYGFLSSVAQTALALLVGLEGRNILVAKHLNQGWRMADVLYADSRADAELRYYNRPKAARHSTVPEQALEKPAPSNHGRLPWAPRTA